MQFQNVFDDLHIPTIPHSYNETAIFSTTQLPSNSENIISSNIDEVEEMALLLAYYSQSTPHTENKMKQYRKKAATTPGSCESDLPAPTRFRRGARKGIAESFVCK